MADSNSDIETLNSLIKTTIDSIDGYRAAAKDAANAQFESLFFERANEREGVADRLAAHVRSLGGTPPEDGSVAAGVHRAFMGLRASGEVQDDAGVIVEVERGEDYIKEKFSAARDDDSISADTRALIDSCFLEVKAGHDRIRDLKHGVA
jgi:uncharacterized protein (TIGR02284 family)